MLIKKLKSTKGGLKELLYDNMGVFIVGVLIVVTIFAVGNKLATRGANNNTNLTNIEDKIKDQTFAAPSGSNALK